MKENILILNDQQMAIKPDIENKILYIYDIDHISGDIVQSSEGILREIDYDIGVTISDMFGIELRDYGVSMINKSVDTDIKVMDEF